MLGTDGRTHPIPAPQGEALPPARPRRRLNVAIWGTWVPGFRGQSKGTMTSRAGNLVPRLAKNDELLLQAIYHVFGRIRRVSHEF